MKVEARSRDCLFILALALCAGASGCHGDAPAPDLAILTLGPLQLGEPASRAIHDLGNGANGTYGGSVKVDHLPARLYEDADGLLGIVIKDGRVAAIEVQQRYDRLDRSVYGIDFDRARPIPRPKLPLATMRWLGEPLFSKQMRPAPAGWSVDPSLGSARPGGRNVGYRSTGNPAVALWYEDDRFGIQSLIVTTFPQVGPLR